MMARFPSWWHISDEFPPRLFQTVDEVPPGWTRCKGHYNAETGQWEDADPLDHDRDGKKGGAVDQIDAADLPAFAGYVRDGFDRDDPENGNPARPVASFEPRAEIVLKEGQETPKGAKAAPKPKRGVTRAGKRNNATARGV